MSDCIEHQGFRMKSGYGTVGRHTLAHRAAWEKAHGLIPEGMCVCHHCDNPPCVNVEHLFLGTKADNNRDCREKGRSSGGSMPGETNPFAKLKNTEREAIKRLYNTGAYSQHCLADAYGISQPRVSEIVRAP